MSNINTVDKGRGIWKMINVTKGISSGMFAYKV